MLVLPFNPGTFVTENGVDAKSTVRRVGMKGKGNADAADKRKMQ
jgi:hypothetical protein